MAADLPLPGQIWAHGWLLFDSEKMSKSRGNVVRPMPIVKALGIESLRYYLLRGIVFGLDGGWSYDALVRRRNSDLANGLGNLASRTLTMIERYFGGEIPTPAPDDESAWADTWSGALTTITQLYDRFSFSLALERIWEQVAAIDKFLTIEKPWTLAEKPEDRQRLGDRTLHRCGRAEAGDRTGPSDPAAIYTEDLAAIRASRIAGYDAAGSS